ncbi:2-oxo-4-hydroxy-4-carboxy-5-ureidoimidazoline decarboxylase [Halorientalis sp.]|uniref:2-oxo-4-hydroxy-4-carboxy-5-ureidoimidazoline decarboxylase n=1 Tax=Halorientalis sp. TaxID=1931229 RepID=UPI00262936C5|nr:2-oxo-4-hydroxy-4-carboxy-5-ureidoimidazoline decarboxylase [Halorientalis sp.]
MSEYTIEDLNELDEASFVELLGGIYENSPWVAEQTWPDRPFDSLDDLHERMRSAVREAPRTKQLALLRAHPDLGDRTEMTDTSEAEQASAGLDSLSPGQYETFQRLNENYRERFGFPFIMAVRNESPDVIQTAMEDRIENTEDGEFRTALGQVHQIAQLRLEELLA